MPVVLSMMLITPAQGWSQDSAAMKTSSFQFSFITPVGTNGLSSWHTTNHVSINLLAGYSGGLDGAEFSGLISVTRRTMSGAQFSGLGNLVLQDITGVQFSGLFNTGTGNLRGAQFAGLCNVVTDSTRGFQAGGLANVTTSAMHGMQLSGFTNYAAGGKVSQVSGFANITAGSVRGAQIAGFTNINTGRLSGSQIAGFFNYTGKLRGAQIGVFNYTDSLEKGVAVGFLSFVRNGYHALEIGSNETMYGLVSFKTGTKQFYNILSVGGGYRDGTSLFAWGYGLGTYIPLSQRVSLSIDGTCHQVNEGGWFTDRLNLLNRLTTSVAWKLNDDIEFFGGIAWNVTVTDITDSCGEVIVPKLAPWSLVDETFDNDINMKMYPGISAGFRL